jgi:hypothetical protein
MGMAVSTLSLQTTYPQSETKLILDEAFRKERDFAHAQFKRFDHECQTFEKAYGIGSDQFLQQFESGELGDDEQWFDWYAAVRGKKTWERKYQILSGIAWNE